jgi:hypothetical protein
MDEQELTAFSGSFEPSKDATRPAVGKGLNVGWAKRNSGRETEPAAAKVASISHGSATATPRVSC